MDRIQRIQRFAEMHYKARCKADKSQEYMAMELGVAKKTVQNWEKGISSPSFFQSLEWFRALGINPMPYYVSLIYPSASVDVDSGTDDEEIDKAFDEMMKNIPRSGKRALLFLFYGKHGSSPNAIMNMMLAHLHTPMQSRTLHARLISETYEMDEKLGNIVCPDNIRPNITALNKAIDSAKNATINKQNSYNNISED